MDIYDNNADTQMLLDHRLDFTTPWRQLEEKIVEHPYLKMEVAWLLLRPCISWPRTWTNRSSAIMSESHFSVGKNKKRQNDSWDDETRNVWCRNKSLGHRETTQSQATSFIWEQFTLQSRFHNLPIEI